MEAVFTRFVARLSDHGYSFHGIERAPPSFAPGRAYLRYDLRSEAADFEIGLRLARLHERLRIPGSFYFSWDLIEADARLRAMALRFRDLDGQYARVGLQCDPISGWLARTRFAGDERRLAGFVRSRDFAPFLDGVLAAWRGEGGEAPALRAIREGAWNRFVELDRSFRTSFADATSVSGRGSPLSAAFTEASRTRPALALVAPWLCAVDFLSLANPGLQRLGYGGEATRFPSDEHPGPSVIFGGQDEARLRTELRERLAGGYGFIAIFPARKWDGAEFDGLIPPAGGQKSAAAAPPGIVADAEIAPAPAPASGTPSADPFLAPLPADPVLTNPGDLAPLGNRGDGFGPRELAAAARQKLGAGIDASFPRFVAWLRAEGYAFAGFEDGLPRFDERRAYLRYDVHGQDLLAAYVLAEWHVRLGIVGSFQINWRHSGAEEAIEPYFLKLLEFDRRWVQFGLHAAPTATWYLHEKLGGDLGRQREVAADGFAEWLLELLAAYERDGEDAPGLREIRTGTDDTLARLAASFRANFGVWKSLSGHGNYLTVGFVAARRAHPQLAPLSPYFSPVEYMKKFGVARFGFDFEATALGWDQVPFPRLIAEGAPEAVRRRWCRGRVAHGAGFVALLHPATWTCRRNAAFFLPEPMADAAG